jgi:hypothetical protein
MRTRAKKIRAALALALLGAAGGCRESALPVPGSSRIVRARADASRSLLALVPDHTAAGEVFQEQPGGQSGLALLGTGFTRDDVVAWGGRALPTTYGHSRLLTAQVPPELVAWPGDVEVTVQSPPADGRKPVRATFHVAPPRPAAPLYHK